jgi:hypothetical protein
VFQGRSSTQTSIYTKKSDKRISAESRFSSRINITKSARNEGTHKSLKDTCGISFSLPIYAREERKREFTQADVFGRSSKFDAASALRSPASVLDGRGGCGTYSR